MLKTLVATSVLCCVIGGSAVAQPAAPSATDKQAISKACSTQADAKGLHGKERKKFRSQCRRNGGKSS